MRHTCDHGSRGDTDPVHLCDCTEFGRDHTADQYDDRTLGYWRARILEG